MKTDYIIRYKNHVLYSEDCLY